MYFNGTSGETEAVNLEPYSQDVVYNTWAGSENIGQMKYNGGSYTRYYYLKDHLGDIKMVLNSTGAVDSPDFIRDPAYSSWDKNERDYNDGFYPAFRGNPFGETMPGRSQFNAGPDPRYQFTSKELDSETGLYHLGARSYDPWSGRFLSVDPLGDLSSGESPYDYSHDNPIEFSDPSGGYSYEIDGVPVSNEVGQTFAQDANIRQFQLDQQAQQYQEQNRVSQITQNLSGEDQNLLTALGASEASPNDIYPTEIAGILFSIFNRLATGYGKARSISDVIFHPGAYYGITKAIFFYALHGYLTSNSNFGKGFIASWNSPTYGPARILHSYDVRIARVRNVLNGIMSGSVGNPVGNSLFYHSTLTGNWNTQPFSDFLMYLHSTMEPPGFNFYYYGNTIFFNWNGIH